MGIGRILPGVTTLNGKIFVFGGEQEAQILANGECYDPIVDTWSPIHSMVVPRCEFGLATLHGYLYAIGGWVGEDIGDSIERLELCFSNLFLCVLHPSNFLELHHFVKFMQL